jgi:predicted RecB family nuclease
VPTLFEALIDPSGPGVGGETIAYNIEKIGQTEKTRAFSVPPEYADLLIKARRPCGRIDPDQPIVPADLGGGVMAAKITREILEAYLYCKTKAHLKLAGQQETVSDYEALLAANRQEVRQQAIGKILAKHPEEQVATGILLTVEELRTRPAYVLDANLEDDLVNLRFDGLKRVDGPSKLGDFHYVPILFHEGRKIGKEQRLLLELHGLLLSRLQGQMPPHGIIWHGKECRITKLRLNGDLRRTERLLRDVKEMLGAESPPKLILNDHCQVCEFRQRCRNQAVQEDSISLLRGVSEKEIKNYARKGIFTVTQLAHTFRPRRRGKRRPPKENHRYHALQALAVRDKRIYIFGTPPLTEAPVHIYLDIEGNPEEGFDYLIGIIVVQGDEEQHLALWAESRDEEDRIFEQFMETLTLYQDFIIFAYGGYERAFLQRMRKRAACKSEIDRVLKALVNTLSLIYSHIYFPTYSNGLKDIGVCVGCSWTEPEASGTQSIVWRMRWEATHDEQWKQMLIAYNMEDCLALRKVTEFVYNYCAKPDPATRARTETRDGPAVAWVEEIDRLGVVKRRGRKEFFYPEFKQINDCARFDYQRQRVYIRTRKSRKRKPREPRRWRNRKLRVSRRVWIACQKCPSCGGKEITRWQKGKKITGYLTRKKRAYDLVFTSGGIKRKVIECRTSIHQCLGCGETFIPERYQRLAKHFHNLMSWAMHEHVSYRISCPIVSEMFKELFGLTVYQQEIDRFKAMMAKRYQLCYKRLLGKILSGKVLQIDETEVRLRTGIGYVWVFATSEEVVYMYRPTREGEFLKDLLKDFHGVVVSDFYAAYDSLLCPQQKCLLHLMRDMNQELLDQPFDEELQSITGPFGTLLREVVATIDQHGLKRRHLERHGSEVEDLFRRISMQDYRSEAAEALRTRLVKYQEKLFTFIRHDGVPWNNNNAENAIRRFGYYREDAAGRLKESGLKDYLVLLSICHTCHYKGISFLRFLLSRERDLDAFCHRPRRRRQSPTIEIYPKGIVRPDSRRRINLNN